MVELRAASAGQGIEEFFRGKSPFGWGNDDTGLQVSHGQEQGNPVAVGNTEGVADTVVVESVHGVGDEPRVGCDIHKGHGKKAGVFDGEGEGLFRGLAIDAIRGLGEGVLLVGGEAADGNHVVELPVEGGCILFPGLGVGQEHEHDRSLGDLGLVPGQGPQLGLWFGIAQYRHLPWLEVEARRGPGGGFKQGTECVFGHVPVGIEKVDGSAGEQHFREVHKALL